MARRARRRGDQRGAVVGARRQHPQRLPERDRRLVRHARQLAAADHADHGQAGALVHGRETVRAGQNSAGPGSSGLGSWGPSSRSRSSSAQAPSWVAGRRAIRTEGVPTSPSAAASRRPSRRRSTAARSARPPRGARTTTVAAPDDGDRLAGVEHHPGRLPGDRERRDAAPVADVEREDDQRVVLARGAAVGAGGPVDLGQAGPQVADAREPRERVDGGGLGEVAAGHVGPGQRDRAQQPHAVGSAAGSRGHVEGRRRRVVPARRVGPAPPETAVWRAARSVRVSASPTPAPARAPAHRARARSTARSRAAVPGWRAVTTAHTASTAGSGHSTAAPQPSALLHANHRSRSAAARPGRGVAPSTTARPGPVPARPPVFVLTSIPAPTSGVRRSAACRPRTHVRSTGRRRAGTSPMTVTVTGSADCCRTHCAGRVRGREVVRGDAAGRGRAGR